MNRTKKRKGISLAELIMTCMLITVMSGVGYAALDATAQQQAAKTGLGQVAYAVKTAKYYARSKGVVTLLTFTSGSNTFDILANDESITGTENFGTTSGKLPDDVKIISNNCPGMGFSVDGSLVDEWGSPIYNDCEIVVGYSSGPQETIKVKGKTGIVDYEE